MRIVHYSKDDDYDFEPKSLESLPGFGEGCFFYPADADGGGGWPGRTAHYFDAPDHVLEYVQEFDPGEAGNVGKVIEVFVRAENLRYIERA